MMFSPVDFGILAILGILAVRGGARGAVKEFFMMVGVVAAVGSAGAMAPRFERFFAFFLGDSSLVPLLAYVGGFLAVYVLFVLLGKVFSYVLDWSGLGLLNRVFGVVLGLAEGVLFSGGLLLMIKQVPPLAHWVRMSVLAPYVMDTVRWAFLAGRQFLPSAVI